MSANVSPTVRIASYHIGNPQYDPTTTPASQYIKILNNIRHMDAQVLAIQGCSKRVFDCLMNDLETFGGTYSEHLNNNDDDGIAILFNNRVFRAIAGGGNLIESASDGTSVKRAHQFLRLERRPKEYFEIYNCDLFADSSKPQVVKEHAETISAFIAKRAAHHSILCGGFNQEHDDVGVKLFTDQGFVTDGNLSETEPSLKRRSDFILRQNNRSTLLHYSKCVNLNVLHEDASSHLPVITDFVSYQYIQEIFNTRFPAYAATLQKAAEECSNRSEVADYDDLTFLEQSYGAYPVSAASKKALSDIIEGAFSVPATVVSSASPVNAAPSQPAIAPAAAQTPTNASLQPVVTNPPSGQAPAAVQTPASASLQSAVVSPPLGQAPADAALQVTVVSSSSEPLPVSTVQQNNANPVLPSPKKKWSCWSAFTEFFSKIFGNFFRAIRRLFGFAS